MATAPGAHATPGDQFTLEHDMDELAKALESKPNLEGFNGLGVEFDNEAEKAIASVENLEKMYDGSSYLESKPYPGLKEVVGSESQISDLREADEAAYKSLPSGGSVEEAVGAESLDAAESAGLVTSAAAGVAIGLIPLGAKLAYEDITTGTNFVSQAVFSSTEDNKKIEEEGGVGAEGMRWVRYPTLPSGDTVGNRIAELYFAKCYPITHVNSCAEAAEAEDHVVNGRVSSVRTSGSGPYATGKPDYYLEPEAYENWYLDGSQGCYAPLSNPSGLVGTGSKEKWNWEPCAEGDVEGIAGYPTALRHVATETIISEETASEGFLCSAPPFEHGCPSGGQEYWSTLGVRAPSRMHVGIPRADTKAHMEELESEGHYVKHDEGHVPDSSTSPTVIKKLAAKLKEHGQRRQEEFECHYMTCELEHVEPQPETGQEPALPEKRSEIPPPVPGLIEIPSCTLVTMSGTECVSLLKTDGFTSVELDTVTWEHADVSKPAHSAIDTSPGAGSVVEITTKIRVDQNPATEEMPAEVPHIHRGMETGTEYKERIESEGWTKVTVKTLTETATDPGIGPDQASYTVPSEGSSEAPSKSAPITVEQNPTDAPTPSESGSFKVPKVDKIDWPSIATPCTRFPFGVPCWLVEQVEGLVATARAPSISIKIATSHMTIDLSHAEPFMEVMRVVEGILTLVGVVLLFGRFASSSSGSSDGGGD